MPDHDEARLPRWARWTLDDLRSEVATLRRELANLQAAHTVLAGREWFAINGPDPAWSDREVYHLWFLDRDDPRAACSLRYGDVLLVGRKQSESPTNGR